MNAINKLQTVDPMTEGRRALDEKTEELVGKVGVDEPYDLVVLEQPYPWTEYNTPEDAIPEPVEPGKHQKGVIQLAGIDVENQELDLFYSSPSRFENDAVQRALKMGRSVEQVNQALGTDWSSKLYFKPEKAVYNVPEPAYDSGVFYTSETLEEITSSEAFSELSRGNFGGWLELSPEELLEP
ncbi:MAG: hypothetical protein ABEJ69_02500 [Candidatus Nanohaloarchaea archaeon]